MWCDNTKNGNSANHGANGDKLNMLQHVCFASQYIRLWSLGCNISTSEWSGGGFQTYHALDHYYLPCVG